VNPAWRKSTYSSGSGSGSGQANCVEVGVIPWRKSTYSDNGGAGCIEAGRVLDAVLVRDTQQFGTGSVLRVSPADWGRLTSAIRADSALS
jgi:hypothetical protein